MIPKNAEQAAALFEVIKHFEKTLGKRAKVDPAPKGYQVYQDEDLPRWRISDVYFVAARVPAHQLSKWSYRAPGDGAVQMEAAVGISGRKLPTGTWWIWKESQPLDWHLVEAIADFFRTRKIAKQKRRCR